MIDVKGNTIAPGDVGFRHFWRVCGHYHEKCPWALGEEGSCDIEYIKYHCIYLDGREPNCPFKYREQI